jgi:S1-C subfamily serine protease
MRQRVQQSLGSGVIVRADGLILTADTVQLEISVEVSAVTGFVSAGDSNPWQNLLARQAWWRLRC